MVILINFWNYFVISSDSENIPNYYFIIDVEPGAFHIIHLLKPDLKLIHKMNDLKVIFLLLVTVNRVKNNS